MIQGIILPGWNMSIGSPNKEHINRGGPRSPTVGKTAKNSHLRGGVARGALSGGRGHDRGKPPAHDSAHSIKRTSDHRGCTAHSLKSGNDPDYVVAITTPSNFPPGLDVLACTPGWGGGQRSARRVSGVVFIKGTGLAHLVFDHTYHS